MATAKNKGVSAITLLVVEGPETGRRFTLGPGEHIVGSETGAGLRLDNPGVDPEHATITVGQGVMLEDRGSRSGTLLNDQSVVLPERLYHGDVVRVGPYHLRVAVRDGGAVMGKVWWLVLAAALALLLLGAWLYIAQTTATLRGTGGAVYTQRTEPTWRDWDYSGIPTRKDLEAEGTAIEAQTARNEYEAGERQFLHRVQDAKAYGAAVVHFKRCLGVLALLPADTERPALAGRALNRLIGLNQEIMRELQRSSDAVSRLGHQNRLDEADVELRRMITLSPRSGEPYHDWAADQMLISVELRKEIREKTSYDVTGF